jgi:hypothetical protein
LLIMPFPFFENIDILSLSLVEYRLSVYYIQSNRRYTHGNR